jgi:hypothetical protein
MHRALTLKFWLRGLVGAIVGGAANSITLMIMKPEDFNLAAGFWDLLNFTAVSAMVSAALFLKQHPIPDEEEPVKDHYTPPPPITAIALISVLLLSGCATLQPHAEKATPYVRGIVRTLAAVAMDAAISESDRVEKRAIIGGLSGFVGTLMTGEPMTAKQVENALGAYLPKNRTHWSTLASGIGSLRDIAAPYIGKDPQKWLDFWGEVSLGLSEAAEL